MYEKNNNEEFKRKKKVYKNKIDENAVRNHEVDSNHDGICYSCDQCDHSATQKDHFKYHEESNHDKTHYNCDQCDYSATRKDQLTHHVEATHEKLFYNCEQYAYKEINKEYLKQHVN